MRTGMNYGLLDGEHGSGCTGTEYSACRPVVVEKNYPGEGHTEEEVKVIYMVWCGECGAADWDFV